MVINVMDKVFLDITWCILVRRYISGVLIMGIFWYPTLCMDFNVLLTVHLSNM